MKVLSGTSNIKLSKGIAKILKLKLVDSKILKVVDNTKANIFIQILFSLIMTLFLVSTIEFFIKRGGFFIKSAHFHEIHHFFETDAIWIISG